MNEVIDAESTAVTVTDAAGAMSLFAGATPREVVASMRDTATALREVIEAAHGTDGKPLLMSIPGKPGKYVRCEGWTTLGAMVKVFPFCEWTRDILRDGEIVGVEARVFAQTMTGAVIGAAEAACTRDERKWEKADYYAMKSMAQTRATSKALRMPLGFIMTLAGYDATPAEEMTFAQNGQRNLAAEGEAIVAARQKGPKCPKHGPLNFKPAGVSAATKKPYSAYWICIRSCTEGEPRNGVAKPYNMFDDQWRLKQQMEQPKEGPDADPDDLPHE